jgi:hypothetical protein
MMPQASRIPGYVQKREETHSRMPWRSKHFQNIPSPIRLLHRIEPPRTDILFEGQLEGRLPVEVVAKHSVYRLPAEHAEGIDPCLSRDEMEPPVTVTGYHRGIDDAGSLHRGYQSVATSPEGKDIEVGCGTELIDMQFHISHILNLPCLRLNVHTARTSLCSPCR